MTHKISTTRRFSKVLLALIWIYVFFFSRFVELQATREVVRSETLTNASPLTTDGNALYGVAEDHKTVLVRPQSGESSWTPFPIDLAENIGGLTYAEDYLYVSDTSRRSIYRINIHSREAEEFFHGGPLNGPTELAIVGNLLFIADPAAQTIQCLDILKSREMFPFLKEPLGEGPYFLAGDGSALVIAAPHSQKLMRINNVGTLREWHSYDIKSQRLSGSLVGFESKQSKWIDSVSRQDYPGLDRAGALAIYRGVTYAIDYGTENLFVLSAGYKGNAIRMSFSEPISKPSRLLVSSDFLFILDDATHDIVIKPRLLPTEIHFERASLSESMTAFYYYLFHQKILPTRTVPLVESVEKTLRSEQVLLAPYVTTLEPLLCNLNKSLCHGSRLKTVLQPNQPLVVPDLFVENYVDVRMKFLNGQTTLGAIVDDSIQSPEFYNWKTEERLKTLNPHHWNKTDFRDLTKGEFRIPIEFVKYIGAVPSRDINDEKSQLNLIRHRFPGVEIIPLEERMATAQLYPGPDGDDLIAMAEAYKTMLETIHFELPRSERLVLPSPRVGIAEAAIEKDHPDFRDPQGGLVFEPIESEPEVVDVPSIEPPTADQINHGTMVASLVGARQNGFNKTGLAPMAIMIQMHKDDQPLAEDVQYSNNQMTAQVFNLSLAFESDRYPVALARKIDDYKATALFVVSAGNNKEADVQEVCKDFHIYPACFGDKPNVLVVAATDLKGESMLFPEQVGDQKIQGSNWSPKFVHVAAPGKGFYAAGSGGKYTPAFGTSAATPLVTAAALLLNAQGIVNPYLIKQRIIATADEKPALKPFVQSGLLNFKRAVTLPGKALLVDDSDREKYVELISNKKIVIQLTQGTETIPIQNIRRFTRKGDRYHVLYFHTATNQLVSLEKITYPQRRNWEFHYYELNDQLQPITPVKIGNLSDFKDFIGPISQQ